MRLRVESSDLLLLLMLLGAALLKLLFLLVDFIGDVLDASSRVAISRLLIEVHWKGRIRPISLLSRLGIRDADV